MEEAPPVLPTPTQSIAEPKIEAKADFGSPETEIRGEGGTELKSDLKAGLETIGRKKAGLAKGKVAETETSETGIPEPKANGATASDIKTGDTKASDTGARGFKAGDRPGKVRKGKGRNESKTPRAAPAKAAGVVVKGPKRKRKSGR